MSYPTATTCTKCGKTATMTRRETGVMQVVKDRAAEPAIKLGYTYIVKCPHCGFQFTSRPKS